jgi:DeoR/GlpR family transcriptional regulator of sugar metabolism
MKAERRRKILELIARNGQVTVADIVSVCHVSEMTARRDLADLARDGLLRRVYGGAMSSLGRSYEPPYLVRATDNLSLKQTIGKTAASMISDGDSIAFDVGTTTLEIVRALEDSHNLTIVTASLPIANEIVTRFSLDSDIRLILTGGIVRAGELSMIGEFASRIYGELHVDKAFIGIGGISLKDGLTEYNLEDALVKRALIASARQVVVVTDGSKFGRTTTAQIVPLTEIDVIITDQSADQHTLAGLEAMGIEVVIVDQE